jgi:hypothetical protein
MDCMLVSVRTSSFEKTSDRHGQFVQGREGLIFRVLFLPEFLSVSEKEAFANNCSPVQGRARHTMEFVRPSSISHSGRWPVGPQRSLLEKD